MKATEFANFFEFSIQTKEDYGELPKGLEHDCFCLCDIKDIKYVVTDDQGCFSNRYISDVRELADCFDPELPDYIDSNIEEDGFVYDEKSNDTYYEQALKWCDNNGQYIGIKDIIRALVDPSTIEDDVKEVST